MRGERVVVRRLFWKRRQGAKSLCRAEHACPVAAVELSSAVLLVYCVVMVPGQARAVTPSRQGASHPLRRRGSRAPQGIATEGARLCFPSQVRASAPWAPRAKLMTAKVRMPAFQRHNSNPFASPCNASLAPKCPRATWDWGRWCFADQEIMNWNFVSGHVCAHAGWYSVWVRRCPLIAILSAI